jgi:hypothetical protein
MKKRIALGLAASTLLAAPAAFPCGMPFGGNIRLDPAQELVVTHKGTTETYQFSPHFCGKVANFGLILPVPGTLVANPAIGDIKVKTELATIAAPTVETRTACWTSDTAGAGGASIGVPGGYGDAGRVTVINAGTVGIFDWTFLKADSTKAFTDWLTANGYPYQPAAQKPFSAYVTDGWYFVAFKITAATQAPPAGQELCGDLGPIRVSFTSPRLVIPARITASAGSPDAGVESSQRWHVFTITAHDQQFNTPLTMGYSRQFAGSLSATDISTYLAVAPIASAGDRVNEFNLEYVPSLLTSDIWFDQAPTDTDYRRVVYNYVYVDCGTGGAGGGGGSGGAGGATDGGGNGGTGGVAAGAGGSTAGSGGATATVDAAAGGPVATAGSSGAGGSHTGSGGSQTGPGGATTSTGGTTALAEEPQVVVGGGDSCSMSARSRDRGRAAIALGLMGALIGLRRRRRTV